MNVIENIYLDNNRLNGTSFNVWPSQEFIPISSFSDHCDYANGHDDQGEENGTQNNDSNCDVFV